MFTGIAALVSALVGIGTTVYGAVKSRNAARDAESALDAQRASIKKDIDAGYMNTAEAKAASETAKEALISEGNRQANLAALTGATHEAQNAMRQSAAKSYADALRDIAAQGTQWKKYQQARLDGVAGAEYSGYQNQSAQGANMVKNGIDTIGSAVSLGASALDGAAGAKAAEMPDMLDGSRSTKTTWW